MALNACLVDRYAALRGHGSLTQGKIPKRKAASLGLRGVLRMDESKGWGICSELEVPTTAV